jgi:hypothetical protein
VHKQILASFRGAPSHPCRDQLRAIHDGRAIICELVPPDNHIGHIDARAGKGDERYQNLLAASCFAFVPRGDRLFSYRLLEVMAFGCVPIILSDGWVLPFDRCIPWTEISLHLPESSIRHLPEILQRIPRDQVIALQTRVIAAYRRFFGSFDLIVEGLFREIETIIGQADADIG